ncbi:MAG TPA: hypothetical protein VFP87_05755 [Chitinophagaceae bacterium]|nr:hypothetical protein [Chitinophagaceae bacterium]
MPDIFDLLLRWWKQILSLMIITLVITSIIVLLVPKEYMGVATALPASTYAQDKSGVFSQNMQNLYSALGSPDDLDMIVGTAHLDTVYHFVAQKLSVADHYHLAKSDGKSILKAAHLLKKKTRVIKSDYGELKVKAWDTNCDWAAALSNAIMEKLQVIYQDVQTTNNATMLARIRSEYDQKKLDYQKLSDSLQHATDQSTTDLLNMQKSSLLQQMAEYEKLSDQYTLMVNAKPQMLIVVERATPPLKPDKPRSVEIIIAAAALSLFFGIMAAVVLERRRVIVR